MAIALTVGIAGAFATKAVNMPVLQEPVYDWISNDQAPSNPEAEFTGSIAQARLHYGCTGFVLTCAVGTKVSGSGSNTVQIFHS